MSRVIDEFQIDKYRVLKLDEMPQKIHRKYQIRGEEFEIVPVYDAPCCIAVQFEPSFIGETVEFI